MTETITYDQLCEFIPDDDRCPLDCTYPPEGMTMKQAAWRLNGYFILQNLIPVGLIDAYCDRYERDNGEGSKYGYAGDGTIYLKAKEIKDICLYKPLVDVLNSFIGEPVGLSLNLCNWSSTERTWHIDDYLNPPEVNGHYIAVWIALDDIHPDAGPFEFVPGSHKWPPMRGEKVMECLPVEYRDHDKWPKKAEDFVTDIYDAEIEKRGAKVRTWIGRKGDVLIWHSWLVHRGSKPKNPDLLRKGLIAHYSGINHRPDMREPILYKNGESEGHYFPF